MKNIIARFFVDEFAATAIEYGLIAAGISLAIIAAVNGLGSTEYEVLVHQHIAEIIRRRKASDYFKALGC